MTHLPVSIPLPPKPTAVSLCELAIAAGLAGQSVAVHFHDYPAHVLCKLWQYSMHFVGPEEVHHVRSQADLRKLPGTCGTMKLVLVYPEKLRTAASWAVAMASQADTEANSRPAIFSAATSVQGEDDLAVALVLRADPGELATISRWFSPAPIPTVPNWQALDRELSIAHTPPLAPVLSSCPGEDFGLRLRDQELLHPLLAGSAVLRSLEQDADHAAEINAVTVTLDDYEQVRLLLQSPPAASTDEACDPLATAMVSRANVYLEARYDEPLGQDNPFSANGADSPPSRGANRELITRREVADLGNIRSRLVRQLVEFLRHRSDGYERFQRMGLVRRPPPQDHWQNLEAVNLVHRLRPWTAKQVRTHFDHLRRSGMIAAERETGNGPWHYVLPEELQGRHKAYRRLPTAAKLLARQPPI